MATGGEKSTRNQGSTVSVDVSGLTHFKGDLIRIRIETEGRVLKTKRIHHYLAVRPLLGAVILLAFVSSGCGVRTFNAKIRTPPTNFTGNEVMIGHGPFWAASQDSGPLTTEECKTVSGRKCLGARVVTGMPWIYDSNTHLGSAPVGQSPVNPHSTIAGAGKTRVASGPRSPNLPAVENRDLFLLSDDSQ